MRSNFQTHSEVDQTCGSNGCRACQNSRIKIKRGNARRGFACGPETAEDSILKKIPLGIDYGIAKTSFGEFQIGVTDQGIREIRFPGRHLEISAQKHVPPLRKRHLATARLFLKQYFMRTHPQNKKLEIDWQFAKSVFMRSVLMTLVRIPEGMCVTYGNLAKRAGFPKAARAVGTLMRQNPIPILVPCHRVIREGSLGRYSAGVTWKRTLLKLENVN